MQSTSVTRREVTLIGLYVALEAGFSEGVLFGDYREASAERERFRVRRSGHEDLGAWGLTGGL